MPKSRCKWAEKEIFHKYHDNEWGIPVHDDRVHFEMLSLEGAQAGLSWEIILKKREKYKKAFDNFDVQKISRYKTQKVEELLRNGGIVRNKLKILSVIQNSKCFIEIQDHYGSFDDYIWSFTSGKVMNSNIKSSKDVPTHTSLSDEIAIDLKERGFKFVGSIIIYSYLQAIGIVNDHEKSCFCKN